MQYTDQNGEDKPSKAIFPGDFVYYFCDSVVANDDPDQPDKPCFCQELDVSEYRQAHVRRVTGVGRWWRKDDNFPTLQRDETVLQIQEAIAARNLDHIPVDEELVDGLQAQAERNGIRWLRDEMVSIDFYTDYIAETNIAGFANAYMDWDYGEDHTDPSPPDKGDRKGKGKTKKPATAFPK
ncbi:hypothetical protein ACHAPU_006981 [Fusarium lateritium]